MHTPTTRISRVLLADDHTLLRQGVKMMLDPQPDFTVVAEAADGAQALDRINHGDIDLAILDITMPSMTGLQVAREVSQRKLPTQMLILSMHDNEQYLFEALKAGAAGYVHKSMADRDLLNACRAAVRGEPFLYPSAMSTIIRGYVQRGQANEGDRLPTPPRRGDPQAHRRGPLRQRNRRDAVHQPQDRRTAPRQLAGEARDEGSPRTDPLRHPRRTHRALNRTQRHGSYPQLVHVWSVRCGC
ncbi:Two-component system response regulator [Propionibacterium freudenreichii]|nr:Two-component system response regulator [Propionibacterium freudenreichii]SCQ79751.1 Two-component system response regulator [Propionibacterium freudenreichii]